MQTRTRHRVRVANDPKPGEAVVRVRIEPNKGYDSKLTDIAVVLKK